MPYTPEPVGNRPPVTAGELANAVSSLIAEYVGLCGLSYKSITEARGALHATLTEFDRRVAFPYESSKMVDGHDPFKIIAESANDRACEAHAAALVRKLKRDR